MAISIRTLSNSDLKSADIILQAAFQRPGSWITELSTAFRYNVPSFASSLATV